MTTILIDEQFVSPDDQLYTVTAEAEVDYTTQTVDFYDLEIFSHSLQRLVKDSSLTSLVISTLTNKILSDEH
jgi:hypothetical protein